MRLDNNFIFINFKHAKLEHIKDQHHNNLLRLVANSIRFTASCAPARGETFAQGSRGKSQIGGGAGKLPFEGGSAVAGDGGGRQNSELLGWALQGMYWSCAVAGPEAARLQGVIRPKSGRNIEIDQKSFLQVIYIPLIFLTTPWARAVFKF